MLHILIDNGWWVSIVLENMVGCGDACGSGTNDDHVAWLLVGLLVLRNSSTSPGRSPECTGSDTGSVIAL